MAFSGTANGTILTKAEDLGKGIMEIKTGVLGVNKLWLVYNEELTLDSVINNRKPQWLFSKGLKSSKICFSVINRTD